MKRHISLVILLTFLMGVFAVPTWAQFTGTVKGVAKDENGKPIDAATVELLSVENGRKVNLKTNAKGEYFSIGIAPGTYKFSLIKDGKVIDFFDKVPVQAGAEREINFDLAKERAQAAQQAGITPEQQKKMEEAQKKNEAIKGLNAQLAQARELATAGNYDQAIGILQQATQTDPSQDVIWGNLGQAQLGAKKYPEAIESYQKAIALKPTSGVYHAGLADAYARSNQTDKAVQEWATAAQNDPPNAGSYYFNEGAVLTNTGKVDEAIAAFDKALQVDPNRADAYYWKGVDLMGKATTKGDKMVAPPGTAEAFNKYLELAPTGKYADPPNRCWPALAPRLRLRTERVRRLPRRSRIRELFLCQGGNSARVWGHFGHRLIRHFPQPRLGRWRAPAASRRGGVFVAHNGNSGFEGEYFAHPRRIEMRLTLAGSSRRPARFVRRWTRFRRD